MWVYAAQIQNFLSFKQLFVELHELKTDEYTSDVEWRQTARWIKYEEDVELGPDRWGKPHVPPLCFHSLIKLRQCIEAGIIKLVWL